MSDKAFFSVGVQSKSSYVQGGIRGIGPLTSIDPKKEYHKTKAPIVELYAERWEEGLDIWTGKPLEGEDLKDWQNQRRRRNLLE